MCVTLIMHVWEVRSHNTGSKISALAASQAKDRIFDFAAYPQNHNRRATGVPDQPSLPIVTEATTPATRT